MTPPARVVIVGAGQAGLQVAASLREEAFAGSITLIGDEPVLPYRRPPLSKEFLRGAVTTDALLLRPARFFADKAIDAVTGRAVQRIDRPRREVVLVDGTCVAYDHLVLATGARSRALPIPGSTLDGVVSLRTQADADDIRARLPHARAVVVIGAGFIGLEVAATVQAMGLPVTVLEAASRPLARAVSRITADQIQAHHASRGITLRCDVKVQAIVGDAGRAVGVALDGGDVLPADLVLIGVGARRNDELAAAAGLAVDDGIVVDRELLTSDPVISAAGDCVAYPDVATGQLVRIESVQNATEQARAVARRLVGRPAPFVNVPWFWSDQGELRLQIVGLTAGHDLALRSRPEPGGGVSVFCFEGSTLRGIESIDRAVDHAVARRLFKARPQPSLRDVLDAGFTLAPGFEAAAAARLGSLV
ncbi:MAG: FAD-dependent oxidoreductase [Pseudomonadota bacterium]